MHLGKKNKAVQYGYFKSVHGGLIRYGRAGGGHADHRGCLLLLNGRSEFMEKYEAVTAQLVHRKFYVLTLDWPGQGMSVRSLANRDKGYIRDFQDYLDDLTCFFNDKVNPLGLPVTVLAHSMGGHMALRFMAEQGAKIEKAVLVSPMVDIVTRPFPRSVATLLSRWAVSLGMGHAYAPGNGDYCRRKIKFAGNPLSHDSQRFWHEHRLIAKNPQLALGGVTWQWLKAAFDSIAYLSRPSVARRISSPVLLMSATRDRVVSRRAQKKICVMMPRATFVSIAGARHEILNEADAVLERFWEAFDRFV